jgi:hypothetical protein
MKAKKLLSLIALHCPKVTASVLWDDHVIIKLPDGGKIDVALEPHTRMCKFPFLYFNVFGSDLRVIGQDAYNGKLNYFQLDAEEKLVELLKELNEKL